MSPGNDILHRKMADLSFSARISEAVLASPERTDYITVTFIERSETRNSQLHEDEDVRQATRRRPRHGYVSVAGQVINLLA